MKRILPLILLMSIILCSCKTKDNLTYFRSNPLTAEQVVAQSDWGVKIEPDDRLAISVSSEMPEVTNVFNMPMTAPSSTEGTPQPQPANYTVDRQGYIIMPKIGRIHVEGMTTVQLAEDITRRVAEFAEAPIVSVSLKNFKVSVMGEVAKPGPVVVNGERITLLEALAAAGDLTPFGRRDNVTLIREQDGQVTYHVLDLSDANTLKSPYYYLQQNDVIYVEPTKTRMDQAEFSVNNSYKVQVASAVVSGVSVIASLIIALTVK